MTLFLFTLIFSQVYVISTSTEEENTAIDDNATSMIHVSKIPYVGSSQVSQFLH